VALFELVLTGNAAVLGAPAFRAARIEHREHRLQLRRCSVATASFESRAASNASMISSRSSRICDSTNAIAWDVDSALAILHRWGATQVAEYMGPLDRPAGIVRDWIGVDVDVLAEVRQVVAAVLPGGCTPTARSRTALSGEIVSSTTSPATELSGIAVASPPFPQDKGRPTRSRKGPSARQCGSLSASLSRGHNTDRRWVSGHSA
jgi:hypothetical protein